MRDFSDREWVEIAEHVWYNLRKHKLEGEWKLEQDMKIGLETLSLGYLVEENDRLQDARSRNIHLRSSISSYITGKIPLPPKKDGKIIQRTDLFDWIVYNWGKISEGSRSKSLDKFQKWDYELNNYALRAVSYLSESRGIPESALA